MPDGDLFPFVLSMDTRGCQQPATSASISARWPRRRDGRACRCRITANSFAAHGEAARLLAPTTILRAFAGRMLNFFRRCASYTKSTAIRPRI